MFAFLGSVLRRSLVVTLLAVNFVAVACIGALAQSDPLPSRNDGAAKKAITDFVAKATMQGGPDEAREYAHDRPSRIGRLDKAWDEAKAKAGPSST
jgi:hypothetical protein